MENYYLLLNKKLENCIKNKNIKINEKILRDKIIIKKNKEKTINFDEKIKKMSLNFCWIINCNLCRKEVKERKEFFENKYDWWILPKWNIINPKYFFIWIAPWRDKHRLYKILNHWNLFCLDMKSWNFLINILKEIWVYENSYFTNIIKCITPKDKIFELNEVNTCIKNHLESEIETLLPKKLIFLWNNAYNYFINHLKINTKLYKLIKKNNIQLHKIYHPSYIITYNPKLIEKYKEKIINIFQK